MNRSGDLLEKILLLLLGTLLIVLIVAPILILKRLGEIKELFKDWISQQKFLKEISQNKKEADLSRTLDSLHEPPPSHNQESSDSLKKSSDETSEISKEEPATEPPTFQSPETAPETEWQLIDDTKEKAPEEQTPAVDSTNKAPLRRPRVLNLPKAPSAFELATRESLQKIKNWILVGEENAPTKGTMENALASQWLMRIGILLLFAGAAYLMKYSIDNNLITETQRVLSGFIAGLGLIATSHKIREGQFSLLRYGLMGTGVGILFIACLAATSLYQLIPVPLGYAVVAAVSTFAGFLTYRHQSLFLAVVGILGAYATPLVIGLQATEATTSQYYAYLFFISAGTLFVCSRKDWPVLLLSAFILHWSQVIYLLNVVQEDQWFQVLAFTIAYCIGFSTISFARHLRLGTTTTFIDMLILVLNAMAYTVSTSFLIQLKYAPMGVALATAGAAIYYAIHAWYCWKNRKLDYSIFQLFCLLCGFFTLITLPKLISTEWITTTWTLAGMGLLIFAIRTKNGLTGRVGLSLLLLGVIRLFVIDLPDWYSSIYWGSGSASGIQYLNDLIRRGVGVGLPVACMVYSTILFFTREPIPQFEEKEDSPQHLSSGFFSILRLFALVSFGSILLYHFISNAPQIPDHLRLLIILFTSWLTGLLIVNWLFVRDQSSNVTTLFDYSAAALVATVALWLSIQTGANLTFGAITMLPNWFLLVMPVGILAATPILRPKNISPGVFLGVASFLAIYISTTEEAYRAIEFLYPGMKDGAKTIMMIINAIGLLTLGLKFNRGIIRKVGLLLIGFSILKMYLHDLQSLENIYRVLSLVFIGALLMVGSTLYLKAQSTLDTEPAESKEDPASSGDS